MDFTFMIQGPAAPQPYEVLQEMNAATSVSEE